MNSITGDNLDSVGLITEALWQKRMNSSYMRYAKNLGLALAMTLIPVTATAEPLHAFSTPSTGGSGALRYVAIDSVSGDVTEQRNFGSNRLACSSAEKLDNNRIVTAFRQASSQRAEIHILDKQNGSTLTSFPSPSSNFQASDCAIGSKAATNGLAFAYIRTEYQSQGVQGIIEVHDVSLNNGQSNLTGTIYSAQGRRFTHLDFNRAGQGFYAVEANARGAEQLLVYYDLRGNQPLRFEVTVIPDNIFVSSLSVDTQTGVALVAVEADYSGTQSQLHLFAINWNPRDAVFVGTTAGLASGADFAGTASLTSRYSFRAVAFSQSTNQYHLITYDIATGGSATTPISDPTITYEQIFESLL